MVVPIEEIEKTIAAYGAAAEVNLCAPGREGNVVVLTPELADEVIITGDLHGNRSNFEAILGLADLEANPRRHLILQEVCHGGPTYASNGGCMSHTMLEDVARLTTDYPGRVHFILGNHELAELTDYPIQKNKQMLNLLFRLGLQEVYGSAADRVREAYFPFLRSCPLGISLPGGIFVTHSIPESADSIPFDGSIFTRQLAPEEFHRRDGVFDLLWGRDCRPENAAAFAQLVGAKVLINGHEPCPEGFNTPNDIQIILDCCNAKACYVTLPTDQKWTHAEIVERIQRLE
jgi:calcineurin-like phosphoesterase family protein